MVHLQLFRPSKTARLCSPVARSEVDRTILAPVPSFIPVGAPIDSRNEPVNTAVHATR
jgi:hypothetical protein